MKDPRNPATQAVNAFLISLAVLGVPLIILMASASKATAEAIVPAFMCVPTAAALIARVKTGQRLVVGRPSIRTLVLAVLPGLLVGGAYFAATLGPLQSSGKGADPVGFVVNLVAGTILALGEEFGWRGYLLPHLRRTRGFVSANVFVLVIWFAYHVPVILIPSLYSNDALPLWANLLFFAACISGFSFFVGLLWEIHHDVWSAGFAHGFWNLTVQNTWPALFVASSPWLMGEFGLLPAVTMAVLAAAVLAWGSRRFPDPISAAPRVAQT